MAMTTAMTALTLEALTIELFTHLACFALYGIPGELSTTTIAIMFSAFLFPMVHGLALMKEK